MQVKRTVRIVGEQYWHKDTGTVWRLDAIGIDERNGLYKLDYENVVRWATSEEFEREFELFLYAPQGGMRG